MPLHAGVDELFSPLMSHPVHQIPQPDAVNGFFFD